MKKSCARCGTSVLGCAAAPPLRDARLPFLSALPDVMVSLLPASFALDALEDGRDAPFAGSKDLVLLSVPLALGPASFLVFDSFRDERAAFFAGPAAFTALPDGSAGLPDRPAAFAAAFAGFAF